MLTDSPSSATDHDGSSTVEQRPPDPSYSLIAKLGLWASHNWKVTLVVWLVVVGSGLWAFFGGLKREGFPPVDLPIVVVDGTYFVDDPALVDQGVTVPLQQAYEEIPEVEEVTTIALPSAFALIVQFESGITSPQGAGLLQPVTDVTAVPDEADVQVRPLDATKFLEVYDILVSVSGPPGATPEGLETEAEVLRGYLEQTPGVVRADVRNLITEGLDPATGEEVARQTRFTRTFFAGDEAYAPAVAIGLVRDPADESLDILSFSDLVNDRLDRAEAPALSDGYSAAVTADFAEGVRTQVNSLIGNLFTGLIAVAFVSFLLIGWRASIITALFMVTVVTAALSGLWLFGYTLNVITLFGLILTLGLLVDDAIVISESIDATRGEGGGAERIVGVSLTRVAVASLAGTLTTVLVFAPLLFVGGVLGEFIRAIPVTVIITLLVSYAFSVFFIPTISRYLLLRGGSPRSPIISAERWLSRAFANLAAFPARGGPVGWGVGVVLALLPIGAIMAAGAVAAGLGFNIFPASKDANALFVQLDFPPGISIEDAEVVASEVDAVVVDVLGQDLARAQYIRGNERGAETFIDLTPFDERDTTAPTYVERLEERFASVDGARVSISVVDAGPPVDDLPFAVQIYADDAQIAAAQSLAMELVDSLPGTVLDKTGEETTIVAAVNSSTGSVTRVDGRRYVEVRGGYDTDDLTNNLDATESLLADRYPPERLRELGLAEDALVFDFGQESDNQEDFASLGTALMVALGLMLVLLVLQFRSLLQPVLVFLAIPFSFLGLTLALDLTDNAISFFSAVGFIALVGVVVNNTILLVDSANQARREGKDLGGAINQAVRRRFRPLVATTLTTLAGLMPLALSDPFWEGLSFTLMGGLVSSTIFVLLSFPVYYLAAMGARQGLANLIIPSRRRARASAS